MENKFMFVLVALLVGTGLLIVVGNAVADIGAYAEAAHEEVWNNRAGNRVSSNVSLSSNTIYVPDDYAKIQWAADNAIAGDTIIVRGGIYNENVDVNKRVTIQSDSRVDKTIVQAKNPDDHVFEVTADYVNISGFTVKGATAEYPYYTAGIYLFGASYCNISNNNVSNNMHDGIGLYESSNNIIANNNANLNGDDGIVLDEDSSNNIIANNNANWNSNDGIVLADESSNNIIANNNANLNGDDGIVLDRDPSNNIIANNNANSNSGTGIVIEDSSNNNNISNNNALNNNCGIYIGYSSNNIIANNNANSNNRYGISLKSASNNIGSCPNFAEKYICPAFQKEMLRD